MTGPVCVVTSTGRWGQADATPGSEPAKEAMSDLTLLEAFELVPVIELEPGRFSTRERPLPPGAGREVPAEWDRYWLDSLADSGVTGLSPLRPASWLVTVRQLTSPVTLGRVLSALVRSWAGPEGLSNPDGRPVLDGGLALCRGGEVLVAPTCCGDLGNLSEWRGAVDYRQPEWKMVWIGHPWVSVRFAAGRLVFSDLHESGPPVARWAVGPEEFGRAVSAAEAELEDFARRLEPVVASLGGLQAPAMIARHLAGLPA